MSKWKNPEFRKQYMKKYYEKNKEKINEYNREYQRNNSEKMKEIKKKYREKNMDKVYVRTKRYRQKRKLEFVLLLGSKCNKCKEKDPRCLVFHHINGRNDGGRSFWFSRIVQFRESISNGEIMLLCANCHRKEHNPILYKEYREINNLP